jgi:hypothetical protein
MSEGVSGMRNPAGYRASGDQSGGQSEVITVEVELEASVLAAMCRRGKKKLRDLEAASRAVLILDRARAVLEISGSRSSVAEVQLQINHMSGPRLAVTGPVWAELMRTRKMDSSYSAVACIQERTACRIHIERNTRQIQVLGPKEVVDLAQRLLHRLESLCSEVRIGSCGTTMDQRVLKSVAQRYRVTIMQEDVQITLLGIKGAVVEAAQELRNREALDDSSHARGGSPPAAHSAIDEALSELKLSPISFSGESSNTASTSFSTETGSVASSFIESNDSLIEGHSYSSSPGGSIATPWDSDDSPVQGVIIKSLPPCVMRPSLRPNDTDQKRSCKQDSDVCAFKKESAGPCSACGATSFCVHCGQSSLTSSYSTCSTCFVANFCPSCGFATTRLKPKSGFQVEGGPSPCGGSKLALPFAGAAPINCRQLLSPIEPAPSQFSENSPYSCQKQIVSVEGFSPSNLRRKPLPQLEPAPASYSELAPCNGASPYNIQRQILPIEGYPVQLPDGTMTFSIPVLIPAGAMPGGFAPQVASGWHFDAFCPS